MKLTAKRVKAGIPIWTLYKDDSFDIGAMTIFAGEGIVATVELCLSGPEEIRGTNVTEVLAKCRAALEKDYADVKAQSRAEAFAEAGASAVISGMSQADAYQIAYAAAEAV